MKKYLFLSIFLLYAAVAAAFELVEVPKTDWTITASGEWDRNTPASNLIHGEGSGWQVQGRPAWVRMDMGGRYQVGMLRYLSRGESLIARGYRIYVTDSENNAREHWGEAVAEGEFEQTSALQEVAFTPTHGRYVILEILSSHSTNIGGRRIDLFHAPPTSIAHFNATWRARTGDLFGNGSIVDIDMQTYVAPGAAIMGYMITEIDQQPELNAPEWQPEPPARYVFTDAADSVQLFLWVKDDQGTVARKAWLWDIDGVVPITFNIPEPGTVTIQILNEEGTVVENLVKGKHFDAGEHTVCWGLGTLFNYWTPFDELRPVPPQDVPQFASPGSYRWRGLFSPELSLEYKWSFSPVKKHGLAWFSADRTGGWLSDHCPPWTVVRTGDTMWVGTFAEGGHGLLEADLGMRKLWGTSRIHLAFPRVLAAEGDHIYYIDQGGWLGHQRMAMIEVNRHNRQARRIISAEPTIDELRSVDGLAVVDKTAYIADRANNKILVVDITENLAGDNSNLNIRGNIPLDRPGRVRPYDADHIGAIAGGSVVLINRRTHEVRLLISGLTNPLGLDFDDDKNIYVGEMDPLHQVLVFDAHGNHVRTIGKQGNHAVGAFDTQNLESPAGVAVDADGNVWVAERNWNLKRTSVWDQEGRCIHEVIGPPEYAGTGNSMDPEDETRYFYKGKEIVRDPDSGEFRLANILWRSDDVYPYRNLDSSYPSYAWRSGGKMFFSSEQGWGAGSATTIYVYDTDHVRPVAYIGQTDRFGYREFGLPVIDMGRRIDGGTETIREFNRTWRSNDTVLAQVGTPGQPFGSRFTTYLNVTQAGEYIFRFDTNQGHVVRINGEPLSVAWHNDHARSTATLHLDAGVHEFVLEHFTLLNSPRHVKVAWGRAGEPLQVLGGDVCRTAPGERAAAGIRVEYYDYDESSTNWSRIVTWTDLSDDGKMQHNEVKVGDPGLPRIGTSWGFRVNEKFQTAVTAGERIAFFHPVGFTAAGYPIYDIPQEMPSTGSTHSENAVFTDMNGNAIASMHPFLVSVSPDGAINWRYKNRWPGLHGGYGAPVEAADHNGVLIAPIRILGSAYINDLLGEVICVGTNYGSTHLYTADGLYIDQVFKDHRRGLRWGFNHRPTPDELWRTSRGQEAFGGVFQRVIGADGTGHVRYAVAGYTGPHSSVVELHGLDKVERLPGESFDVRPMHWVQAELQRQQRVASAAEPKHYIIRRMAGVNIDGRADEWRDFERIEGFALGYDDTHLYVHFEGEDRMAVFQNAATRRDFIEAFKLGDVVDIMLQTRPGMNPGRQHARQGDKRLSFAMVEGEPAAILYDFVVPGTAPAQRHAFSSPWQTVYVDKVSILEDVRIAVLRSTNRYSLEAAVPLASIGLDPSATPTTSGDVGRVMSDQTGTGSIARLYWSNKNTQMMADLPSETRLQPNLWGTFVFENAR